MVTIYHYNPDTGELIGESQADPSPTDPSMPIIPAFATTESPPTVKDGYKTVFINGLWKTVKIKQGS
jgi:hypothetical protein